MKTLPRNAKRRRNENESIARILQMTRIPGSGQLQSFIRDIRLLVLFVVKGFCVFGFWFLVCSFSSAAPLDNITTDSWIYDAVDYLKTTGYIKSIPPTSKPWTRQEVINLLQESNINKSYNNPQAGFYINRLLREFSDDLLMDIHIARYKPVAKINYGSGDVFINLYGQLVHSKLPYWLTPYGNNIFPDNQTVSGGIIFNLDHNSKISLFHHSELTYYRKKIYDTTDANIFHVLGMRVMESSNIITYDVKEAYLSFPFYFLTVELGRDYLYLGPGYRSSVLLSNIAPSMDQIQLRTGNKNYKALWFVSTLSSWYYYHRFLSGQRLEFNLGRHIKLGGTMLAVYSFDSLQTKGFWGYLNPLIPIYEEVANTGHDDNLLIGFDFVTYIKQCKIYGQFLLDNYEFNHRTNRPPNAYGLTLGTYFPYSQFAMRAEYSKITRYTYYHRILHIAYTSYSVPLGHSLGPDADELFLRFEYYPVAKLRLNFVASLTRRGDGNRGDLDNKTWEAGEALPTTFPSGTVEKTILVGPEIYYQPRVDLRVLAGIYYNNDKKVNSFIRLEYRY